MLKLLVLIPFLLLLVAFAVSNTQTVTLALWPTDVTLEAPLSIAVLAIAGTFFLLGGLMVWVPALASVARARRAEKRIVKLEAELVERRRAAPPAATAKKKQALLSAPN